MKGTVAQVLFSPSPTESRGGFTVGGERAWVTWQAGEAICKLTLQLLLLRTLSFTLQQAVYTIPSRIVWGENGGMFYLRGKVHQSTDQVTEEKRIRGCLSRQDRFSGAAETWPPKLSLSQENRIRNIVRSQHIHFINVCTFHTRSFFMLITHF